VPLKLFFALHEIEAKFTEKQLRAVIVLWSSQRKSEIRENVAANKRRKNVTSRSLPPQQLQIL